MTDESTDEFKSDFLMYKKVLEKHPEIASALKDNKRLYKQIEDIKKQKQMLAHELKTPLNALINLSEILKGYESDESKKHILDILFKSAEMMNNLTGILYLNGLSKEETKKKSELLILENLAREHAIVRNKYMQDEKIGLHLKYNQLPYHKPLKMYANKAVMNAIWGTLFTNSLDWAPPLSNITQVFRINKADNLEIIMENEYAEKRIRQNGMSEGIGIPFVKDIAKTMGGDFSTYETSSQIKKDYDMDEWWGYKKGRDLKENTKIYGVKVIIPMKELAKPSEENQKT